MNAGAYKEKIELQKNEYESDGIGNQKSRWETYYRGFAYVNNLSGSEYWEAAQVQSENTVMFFMRYHKLLEMMDTKRFQITWRGKRYNIIFVDNIQNKNETIKIRAIRKER